MPGFNDLDRLGYNGCRRIFEGLAGNISLKELYICGNRCTDKAIPALVAMLKNPDSALEALGISNNSITVEGNDLESLLKIFF